MNIVTQKNEVTSLPVCETCEDLVHRIHSFLGPCYESQYGEGQFDTFLNDFYDDLSVDLSINVASIIQNFLDATKNQDRLTIVKERLLTSVKVSLHYCFEASICHENGAVNEAWYNAAEANKWLGIVYAAEHTLTVFQDELNILARAGAQKRAQKYQPLREFVLEEVRKKNYRSKRNAALSLKPEVLALATNLGIGLSEPQAEKTISGWLNGIPFASKKAS